jgi:NAD(P)-dependent dehydrogenase (short-subunit alcohol dehydrogenase family)
VSTPLESPNLKQAVVIGAGQGIGAVTAELLAAHGLHVILIGRTAAKLDATAEKIRAAGGSAATYAADVVDPAALTGLTAALERDGRALDAVIHCAGEALIKPFDQLTIDDWDHVINVNLRAAFVSAQAFLPFLRRSSNPSLVFMSSKVALRGYGGISAYSAAKTGLVGFVRSLAAELAPEQIRVTALCPGPVATPMRWAATPDFDPALLIQPETVASTIWHIINLPRGTVAGEILIESGLYD